MLWIIIILLALILAALIFGGPAVGGFLGAVATGIAIIIGIAIGIPLLVNYGLYILGGIAIAAAAGALWIWHLRREAWVGERADNETVPAIDQAGLERKARDRYKEQHRAARLAAKTPDREEQIQILVKERLRMRAAGQEATPRFKAVEEELQRLGWR